MSNVTMKYGSYNFEPVPIITLSKQYIKSGDGINRGVTFTLTMTGHIYNANEAAGVKVTTDKLYELRTAFNRDGKLFQINCNAETILECYPRIISLEAQESGDNWVLRIPYTIVIEYENDPANNGLPGMGEDGSLHPAYISDFQESWSLEFAPDESNPYSGEDALSVGNNPYVMRATHNVSAVGKSHYSGSGPTGTLDMPAWQQARNYILPQLGFDSSILLTRSDLNVPTGIWSFYDHYRVNNVDETAGSYSTQESWLMLGTRGSASNARKCVEDFTIDASNDINSEWQTVSIQGSIRGLEERTYGSNPGEFNVTSYKYNNALAFYDTIKGSVLKARCDAAATHSSLGTLNITPAVQTVGHAKNQGIVTYSFSYNTRPSNCIAGSRFENITISDTFPNDVYALIPVMGRPQGPIMQFMNTVSEQSRSLSIEVLMTPATGCSASALVSSSPFNAVQTGIVDVVYTQLSGLFSGGRIAVSQDNDSWQPKVGRYSRNITWVAVPCS